MAKRMIREPSKTQILFNLSNRKNAFREIGWVSRHVYLKHILSMFSFTYKVIRNHWNNYLAQAVSFYPRLEEGHFMPKILSNISPDYIVGPIKDVTRKKSLCSLMETCPGLTSSDKLNLWLLACLLRMNSFPTILKSCSCVWWEVFYPELNSPSPSNIFNNKHANNHVPYITVTNLLQSITACFQEQYGSQQCNQNSSTYRYIHLSVQTGNFVHCISHQFLLLNSQILLSLHRWLQISKSLSAL